MNRFSSWRNDATANEPRRSTEPVFLDEHKARQEVLNEVTTQSTVQESTVNRPHKQELNGSADTRLETRLNADSLTPSEVPIEAQWNVLLALATFTPQMHALEQFEALKANLWSRYSEAAMKVILFVGATPGSGTSTAAANFAAMLAQEPGSKVLLIDANIRARNQGKSAGAATGDAGVGAGLTRLLAVRHPTRDYSGALPSNLWVLPSGAKSSMPLALFQSEAFDTFLRTARERFKYVIVDTPPLQHCPESLVLSQKADGVILVVESEKTRKRSALWAKQQIENVGGKLLGVVLNKRKYYIPNWLYKRI